MGNVVVQRRGAGGVEDVPYDVTFAFVFHAFRPKGNGAGSDCALRRD
ncbi:MAG: hypothetical protein V3T93_01885 [Alphaproteobacteria bacterium]